GQSATSCTANLVSRTCGDSGARLRWAIRPRVCRYAPLCDLDPPQAVSISSHHIGTTAGFLTRCSLRTYPSRLEDLRCCSPPVSNSFPLSQPAGTARPFPQPPLPPPYS